MRTRELVPIGQGCKVVPLRVRGQLTLFGGRCECHVSYYLNICPCCGEKFHTKNPNTVTCSDRCRKRRQRQKHDVFFQTIMALT